jgi:hypothetical protein
MKVIQTIDTIAKAVVGAGGLAITALQPIYGSDKWYVAAIAAYGALSIYFTKNLTADVTVNSSQQTHQ